MRKWPWELEKKNVWYIPGECYNLTSRNSVERMKRISKENKSRRNYKKDQTLTKIIKTKIIKVSPQKPVHNKKESMIKSIIRIGK